MKVDLDELDGKASRAAGRWWSADELHRKRFDSTAADHIAANSPEVTLALIARIHELEAALRGGGVSAGCPDPFDVRDVDAILEKGVTIP